LGIIDEKGKILKRRRDLKTDDEKDAYTLSDTLIWNLKKLLGKIPGGKSRIASYGAALFLIKEQQDGYKLTEEELEMQFFDAFEKMHNNDLEFDPRALKKLENILSEDAPGTTSAGQAYREMPLCKPPKGLVMKKFRNADVFSVDPTMYHKARFGKKKYTKYSNYVGEDEAGQYIRAYARRYPKKPIIVMDSSTGCMQYLRYGK